MLQNDAVFHKLVLAGGQMVLGDRFQPKPAWPAKKWPKYF